MSKKKLYYDKSNPNSILHLDSVEVTRMQRPNINGHVCRCGIHGDTKYNRRKSQAETRSIIDSYKKGEL